MTSITTVWYLPHDDPAVGFIVNDRDDMWENYADLNQQRLSQGTFAEYLDTWPSADIPTEVWESGDDAAIHAHLTA